MTASLIFAADELCPPLEAQACGTPSYHGKGGALETVKDISGDWQRAYYSTSKRQKACWQR